MTNVEWGEEPTRVSRPEGDADTEATIRVGGDLPAAPRPGFQADTIILGGPSPSLAWLVIRYGPRAGTLYRLNPKGTTIGREPQCDIILDDESVSRQHAKLKGKKGKKDRDQYSIWDLASANHTFVNGKEVVKKALQDGDEIKIGETILVFKQV